MSPPAPNFHLQGRANFRSECAPEVSAARALAEWLAVADAIESAGGEVVCLVPEPNSALTGMPYAAEAGHVVEADGRLCLLLPNMLSPHRRPEREQWGQAAARLGLVAIDVPRGIWEAQGDVAEFRRRTLLTYGGRTDLAGVEAVSRWFPSDSTRIQIQQPAFHGNMAVLPLERADKLIVCPDVLVGDVPTHLVDLFGEPAIVYVDLDELRHYACNALAVGRTLIVPHLAPARLVEMTASWGYDVIQVPMVELCEKGGGGPRCLVSRIHVERGRINVPAELRFRELRADIVNRRPS